MKLMLFTSHNTPVQVKSQVFVPLDSESLSGVSVSVEQKRLGLRADLALKQLQPWSLLNYNCPHCIAVKLNIGSDDASVVQHISHIFAHIWVLNNTE